MISKLKAKFHDLSVDTTCGKFFNDKCYKYDVIYFMSIFIENHLEEDTFHEKALYSTIVSYTVEIFNLDPQADGNFNFMSETLNLLEYAKIICNLGYGFYRVLDKDLLHFICEKMENAYIFEYLVTYYTFSNDGLLGFYSLFVNSDKDYERKKMINQIYEKFTEISPSINANKKGVWDKIYTKYPLMVLGLANDEYCIARTLNITNKKITAFSLSANVDGTKTKPEFKKHNEYSKNFDYEYVKDFLKSVLVKR